MSKILNFMPYFTKNEINFYKFPIVTKCGKILTKILIEGESVPVQNDREQLLKLSKLINIETENYYKYITLYKKEINVEYT